MIKTILSIITLFYPLIWELINDRNGETSEEKMKDVLWRMLLTAVAALTNFFLIGKPIIDTILLTLAIHFMFFDYAINIILYKNDVIDYANWFSHTGKKGVIDNIGFWKRMNPWAKLGVRVGVLIAAILIYLL